MFAGGTTDNFVSNRLGLFRFVLVVLLQDWRSLPFSLFLFGTGPVDFFVTHQRRMRYRHGIVGPDFLSGGSICSLGFVIMQLFFLFSFSFFYLLVTTSLLMSERSSYVRYDGGKSTFFLLMRALNFLSYTYIGKALEGVLSALIFGAFVACSL